MPINTASQARAAAFRVCGEAIKADTADAYREAIAACSAALVRTRRSNPDYRALLAHQVEMEARAVLKEPRKWTPETLAHAKRVVAARKAAA